MNTTFVLSGDQSGARSSPSKLSPLRMVSFWPSGSIVTISNPWFLTPANAILVPSGDQAGSISLASVLVMLVASSVVVGSVSITKMSPCSEMTWPGISLTKTIWVPDGAHDGWYSWKLLASGAVGVRLVWFVPSASITQMSVQGSPKQWSLGSVPGLTKTILPSGEVVWAEGFVGSKTLAKNNSAIDIPSKMIARLVPNFLAASCTMSLLSGGHHAELPARTSRMMIVSVDVCARLISIYARALRTDWISDWISGRLSRTSQKSYSTHLGE